MMASAVCADAFLLLLAAAAQALDAVDTLVVPIVLQRDGNF
jgi:hypothetical protein